MAVTAIFPSRRWFMSRIKKDEARENRIDNEIIVDAYGQEEHAMGWYYYLDAKLKFPFLARCITKRSTSPLKVGDEIKAIGMTSEEVCEHEMYVKIKWSSRTLAIPLVQIEPIKTDSKTLEAVEDWHYWVNMGYEF